MGNFNLIKLKLKSSMCMTISYHTYFSEMKTIATQCLKITKSLIQHCERSHKVHFEWTKVYQKYPEMSILVCFWKPETCCQTVSPDRSNLIRRKLVKMQKLCNWNKTFWMIFKHSEQDLGNPEACCQTVLPDKSILIRQKLVGNAKIEKSIMRHFRWFSNNVTKVFVS